MEMVCVTVSFGWIGLRSNYLKYDKGTMTMLCPAKACTACCSILLKQSESSSNENSQDLSFGQSGQMLK